MITDPQTSPSTVRGQVLFGASIGAVYGVFIAFHLVYMIFGALLVVCIARGVILWAYELAPNETTLAALRRWLGAHSRALVRVRVASD
jgi:hypothetical protein